MSNDNYLDSFDITTNEDASIDVQDPLGEDYLANNDAHGPMWWSKLKYWWYRNRLNNPYITGGKPGSRGIPLYDLDPNGNMTTGEEGEGDMRFVYRHRYHVPWKLIIQICGFMILSAVTGSLIFSVVKYNPRNKATHTLNNGLETSFDPYIKYFNGSHEFYPLTIMVSLDGFHPSLISKRFTPFMNDLYTLSYDGNENITSTPYMIPSFPSQTFPNHWSLVTGKYPKDHGIVSNVFWDSAVGEEFHPGLLDPLVWTNVSEPIWQVLQTAFENNKMDDPFKVATHMWPGSDVNFTNVPNVPRKRMPYYSDKFDAKEPLDKKVESVLRYVDMESIDDRPQLILSYVPQVDAFGHKHGYPMNEQQENFEQFTKTLSEVDFFLKTLIESLENRNVLEFTNIVIVSDHGMSNIEFPENVLIWENLLDEDVRKKHIIHAYGEGPLMAITTKDKNEINEIYQKLKTSLANQGELGSNFDIYLNGNFPETFNFNKMDNSRIAPIWIIPKPGYAIVDKSFYKHNAKKGKSRMIGNHGYDNHALEMRSLFIGMGPFFEKGYVEPFENVEIFDMICDIFGVSMNDRIGDLEDNFFYRNFLDTNESFEDDFEYLHMRFGNESTYNVLWGGYKEMWSSASSSLSLSLSTSTSTKSTSTSTSSSSSSSSSSSISTSTLTGTSISTSTLTSATTSATGNWFQEMIEDGKEIFDQVIDEIEDIVNNHDHNT